MIALIIQSGFLFISITAEKKFKSIDVRKVICKIMDIRISTARLGLYAYLPIVGGDVYRGGGAGGRGLFFESFWFLLFNEAILIPLGS